MLCLDLIKIDKWYCRKQAYVKYGIKGAHKPSRMQSCYESHHPINSFEYTTMAKDDVVVITSKYGTYHVTQNPARCKDNVCLVKCSKCSVANICAHTFICNCMTYSMKNMCKHCHLVAMLNGKIGVNTGASQDNNDLQTNGVLYME